MGPIAGRPISKTNSPAMGNSNNKPKPPTKPPQPAPQPLAPKTPPPAPSPPRPSSSSIVGTMLATNISLRRAAITYSDLRFGERLGQGACGEVIKGEYHGTPIVIKKMLQNQINAANVALFANEIQLLSTLRHPNIILFIGASADAQENLYVSLHYDDLPYLIAVLRCLVTEYMERGDLASLLLDPTIALSWKDPLLRFVVDICRGMAYLHSQEPKYIHRDRQSRQHPRQVSHLLYLIVKYQCINALLAPTFKWPRSPTLALCGF